jgi:hypothetical protein
MKPPGFGENDALGFTEIGPLATWEDGSGTRWQVSTAGGLLPVWGPDGQEIFYVTRTGQLQAVSLKMARSGLTFDSPRPLFPTKSMAYDVTQDGKRFLVGVPVEGERDATEMTVLTDWRKGLKR